MNLDNPASVMYRLTEIENDLALRQNALEASAHTWFLAKREKEHNAAVAFMQSEGTDGQRKIQAARMTALDGMKSEAEYESLKAVVRVLETRASILQSILKAQSR